MDGYTFVSYLLHTHHSPLIENVIGLELKRYFAAPLFGHYSDQIMRINISHYVFFPIVETILPW